MLSGKGWDDPRSTCARPGDMLISDKHYKAGPPGSSHIIHPIPPPPPPSPHTTPPATVMGNTSSSFPTSPSPTNPRASKLIKLRTKKVARKRSMFSYLTLGCTSHDQFPDHDFHDAFATTMNEKMITTTNNEKTNTHRRKRSDDSSAPLAHSNSAATLAYHDYTNQYQPPSPTATHTPTSHIPPAVSIRAEQEQQSRAFEEFTRVYPEYKLTWILDTLRRTDYTRLDESGETYVDYMGGAIYPESLVSVHSRFLNRSILGNTHSISNAAQLSAKHAEEARRAVLSFFDASPEEYVVVFTPNASGALKLVGESFPFESGSAYVLGVDSHNSVHGIRQFASAKGAKVTYIPSPSKGGVDPTIAKKALLENRSSLPELVPNLFALTAQSNISNSKNNLSLLSYAKSLGFFTVVDGAALAPTSKVSLRENRSIDAMAVSFYKMFGYPTGVGALILKKSFAKEVLRRPWFAGGTVDVVQVPGTIVTRAERVDEQFEDGTINYLMLPAITDGLRFLSAYLPFLPLRLSALMHYATNELSKLVHQETGKPVLKILSRTPMKRLRSIGDQSDVGSTFALIYLDPEGAMLPLSFVSHVAYTQSISLRTGCMCNPGGSAALLGIEADMDRLYSGVRLADFERCVGRELGVVRISFGLGSNFADAYKVVQFSSKLADPIWRNEMWSEYKANRLSDQTIIGRAL